MKKIAAASTTALLLCVLLIAAALRSGRAAKSATPEDCLNEMFQAMKAGDASTYLNCFTGELRDQLERVAREQPAAGFELYLRQSVAPIRGRAILRDKTEYSGSGSVRIVVDRTYDGPRPWEFQAYQLSRESGHWRICAVEPVEPHEPQIPYGTPAGDIMR